MMNFKNLTISAGNQRNDESNSDPSPNVSSNNLKFLPELVLPTKSTASNQILKTRPTPNPVDKSPKQKRSRTPKRTEKRTEKSSHSPAPKNKQNELNSMMDKAALIAIENERLKSELDSLREEMQRLWNECEFLRNENNRIRADFGRLEDENEKSKGEIGLALKDADQERQKKNEYLGTIRDLRDKMDMLERAQLSFNPDFKKQYEQQLKNLHDEIRMTKLDGEKAREQVWSLEQELRKMEGRLAELQNENNSLKRANDRLKDTIARQESKLEQQTRSQTEFNDKNAQKLEADLQQLRNLLAKEKDKNLELEDEIREQKTKSSIHEKRSGAIGNYKAKALEEELKEKNRMMEAQKARIERQDARIKQLHIDLANKDYSDLSEDIRNLLNRIRELEELNQQLDDSNMMLQHGLHLGGTKIIRKKQKLRNLNHENSQLKMKILEGSNLHPSEVSSIKENLQAYLAKKSGTGDEIDEYNAGTDSSKKRNAMASNVGHLKRGNDFLSENGKQKSSYNKSEDDIDKKTYTSTSPVKGDYGASTSGYGLMSEKQRNGGMKQSRDSEFGASYGSPINEDSAMRSSIGLGRSKSPIKEVSGLSSSVSRFNPTRAESMEYSIPPPNVSFLELEKRITENSKRTEEPKLSLNPGRQEIGKKKIADDTQDMLSQIDDLLLKQKSRNRARSPIK